MGAEAKREPAEGMIRAFRAEDASAVTAIAADTPEAANWAESSYREALNWAGVVAVICEGEGKVTGFIIGRRVGYEAEILNLAVARARRRRGEGGALLHAAMDEFRAHGVSRVFLEVRESNESGIAFYEKHGFSERGRRAGYYHNSDEAAVLMEMNLAG